MCGHSLGGIFLRASLHHLFSESIPNTEWVNLTTLNSPHLGVCKPGGDFLKRCYKFIIHSACEYSNGQTGDDLILKTTVINDIAKEDYLEKFKFVTFVTLAHNDLLVAFPTAGVCPVNPYPQLAFSTPLTLVGACGFDDNYHQLEFRKISVGSVSLNHEKVEKIENEKETSSDNFGHAEFKTETMAHFYGKKMYWRRLDLNVGGLYAPVAHDLTIGKGDKVMNWNWDQVGSKEWLQLLANIFYIDHQ